MKVKLGPEHLSSASNWVARRDAAAICRRNRLTDALMICDQFQPSLTHKTLITTINSPEDTMQAMCISVLNAKHSLYIIMLLYNHII